jgi:hypothetical protein
LRGDARVEPRADGRPLVGEDRVDGGVAPGAVGPELVAAADALEGGAELEDRGARVRVARVGLQLDAAEAGVEREAEEEALGLRVHDRAPDARVVCGPAEVHALAADVELGEARGADELAVVRAADEDHGVGQVVPAEVAAGPLLERPGVGGQARRAAAEAAREDGGVPDRGVQRGDVVGRERVEPDVGADERPGRGDGGGHPASLADGRPGPAGVAGPGRAVDPVSCRPWAPASWRARRRTAAGRRER